MLKITAELKSEELIITSNAEDVSVLDVYFVLATVIRDFANRLDTDPFKLLEELKVFIQIEEPKKEEE